MVRVRVFTDNYNYQSKCRILPSHIKNVSSCTCLSFLLLCRFLFWTEYDPGVITRFNLAGGIKVTLLRHVGDVYAIKLDCNKKRVYWLEYSSSIQYIKSSSYNGKGKTDITEGKFHRYLLGVLGDLLYFLDTRNNRINERNVSDGNISRTFQVDSGVSYYDLLVVDKSLQPTCK